jgi:hypothetical protein
MSQLEVQFGKYRPDYDPATDDVTTLENLLYYDGKYFAFAEPQAYTTSPLTDDPLRLFAVETAAGDKETFVATDLAIHRLGTGPAWTDVSKSGGYSVNSGDTWDWTVYGNTVVCVGGLNVAPQALSDVTAGSFADLGGTPPSAKTCCMYKDHLFFGYTNDGVTESSLRIYRSAQGDIEDWTVASDTGCGWKDLPCWGESIVAMRPIGDRLAVYCTESVWLVDFVGSPYWFSYEQVHSGPGPTSVGSVVVVDNNTHLFLSSEDVYSVTADGTVTSIGAGIRRAVIGTANTEAYVHRISSLYDPRFKTAFWFIPQDDDYCSLLLACNYEEQAYSGITVSGYCLGPITGVGITVDEVDEPVDTFSGITFGSSYWRIGGAVYGIVDSSKYLARFSGSAMQGTIETGERDFGNVVTVTNIRPLIGNPDGSCVVTLSYRYDPWAAVATKSATYSTTTRGANLLASGRLMRLKLVVNGSHDGIRGALVDYATRGRR